MSKHKLTLIDQCLPDYFRGHRNPVMQIPVWKDMTKTDLIEAIESDYNMLWDYLTYEGWPDLKDGELRKMADEFILVDEPFADCDMPTLDECEDTTDDVCIFIICDEVE